MNSARKLEAKRKGLDTGGEADFAELRGEAQLELAHEVVGVEREQRSGIGAPLVPDNARLASRQRQDGEGAGRQEMLLGAALVVALVRDRRDETRLVVVPADRLDFGERPQPRAGAVRRDRKTGADGPAAVGERKLSDMLARAKAGDRGCEARDAEALAERRQGPNDVVGESHMGKRLAIVPRLEMEMGQAHGVAHVPVHDIHLEDRLRLRLDLLPGADALEKPPRPAGDRDRAQRGLRTPVGGGRGRIEDRDRSARAQRLFQRGGERQTGRAPAGDGDVENGDCVGHKAPSSAPHCRTIGASAQSAGDLYQESWGLTDGGPIAHSDGGYGFWLGDEFSPGVAGGVDDVAAGFEDKVR